MRARLEAYKRGSRQAYAKTETSVISISKRKGKITKVIVPASWKQILVIAFVYAVGINIIKHSYYAVNGKPQFVFSNAEAEADFQRLLEKYEQRP